MVSTCIHNANAYLLLSISVSFCRLRRHDAFVCARAVLRARERREAEIYAAAAEAEAVMSQLAVKTAATELG